MNLRDLESREGSGHWGPDAGPRTQCFLHCLCLPTPILVSPLVCAIVITSEQTSTGASASDGSELDLDSTTYLQLNPWAKVWISLTSASLPAKFGKQYFTDEDEMRVTALTVQYRVTLMLL